MMCRNRVLTSSRLCACQADVMALNPDMHDIDVRRLCCICMCTLTLLCIHQADVMALNPDMHDIDVRRLVDSIKQVDAQVS